MDECEPLALGSEFVVLFSGLIFLTDKMSPTFRTALEFINVAVIIVTVMLFAAFVLLNLAPQYVMKISKYIAVGRCRLTLWNPR